jgi:predicted dehydrogenase
MTAVATRPRLGFLGTGWIGRNRLQALAASGLTEIAALADPAADCLRAAAQDAPGAQLLAGDLDALLAAGLDGIVIATPSALHADQAVAALAAGVAVFCQKPLGRTAQECAAVVDAARRADRLLGVDLSYRELEAVTRMRAVIGAGEIGDVYAAVLVFHNAYGPDKPWFTDAVLAGGGCVIDLGIHLVDLGLWLLDGPKVEHVDARLYREGRLLPPRPDVVEDHAIARLDLSNGATVSVTCSWFLDAGQDAVIEATFYATRGAVSLRNVEGSFYDFSATLQRGTAREVLAVPPDDWGGRAALRWADRLGSSRAFDPQVDDIVEVARVLDGMYGR